MATVNLTRKVKNAEKKNICVAAATVAYTDIPGTDNYELFTIPGDCVITGVRTYAETAGQTGLTADIGYAGGTELKSNADLDDTAPKFDAVLLASGTGKTVTIKPDAAPTAGKFHVMVEYIEYTRGNGEYSEYSAN